MAKGEIETHFESYHPRLKARSHTHRENISRYRGVQHLRRLPEVKLLTGEDDHWHWGNHLKPISIGMVNITGAYLSASEIHLSLSSPSTLSGDPDDRGFFLSFPHKNEFRYGGYNLTIWFGQPYRHDASSSYDEKQVYSVVTHNE